MGWQYRRSISAGPFRLNLSRRGMGYSVGVGGFRVGVRPDGRRYRSISIPGTGLYRRDSLPAGGSGCALALVLLVATFAATCAFGWKAWRAG
jgi:hypothetical protein